MRNLKINKLSVITLSVIYLIVLVFHNWEYVWIFKSLFAFNIGYLMSYAWEYKMTNKQEILISLNEDELNLIVKCMESAKDEFGPFIPTHIFYRVYKKIKPLDIK